MQLKNVSVEISALVSSSHAHSTSKLLSYTDWLTLVLVTDKLLYMHDLNAQIATQLSSIGAFHLQRNVTFAFSACWLCTTVSPWCYRPHWGNGQAGQEVQPWTSCRFMSGWIFASLHEESRVCYLTQLNRLWRSIYTAVYSSFASYGCKRDSELYMLWK